MTAQTAFRSEETFTQKEFRRWLDERPRSDINHYELLSGRIVMTPPATWPHGRVEARLAAAIEEHVERNNLGIVLGSSTGYELPSGDTVEPDVSYVSARRLAAGPAPQPGQFIRIVPTLVVEILSPSASKRDQTEKKAIYERNGVEEYWIVDPHAKAVTLFHLGERAYGDGQTFRRGAVRSRALPRLRLAIEKLFAQ
jgi:Uma2 family endonuclease